MRKTRDPLFLLLSLIFLPVARPQAGAPASSSSADRPAASASSPPAKPIDYSSESYVVQSDATDVVYAADGTGERRITVRANIQSDAAVRQFGVLDFAYESRNEHLDFVYVRVRKPDGSVVSTPDTDAQDQPAEVTRQAPFYSDIREKQLPVKSLSVGDQLEYQVREVRTVAAAPGHFWYTQSFVKDAVVLEETASLTVPRQNYVQVQSADIQPTIAEEGDRKVYRWKTAQLEKTKVPDTKTKKPVVVEKPPSIAVTTFKSWDEVGRWYGELQKDRVGVTPAVQAKANELTKGLSTDEEKIAAIYSYVSTQYRYIGVGFGIGRYQPHTADEVMQNQYGDCKDKHTLLASLLKAAGYDAWPALVGSQHVLQPDVPSPGQFDHVITAVTLNKSVLWMDSTPEVAPFRLLFSGLRDKQVLGIPNNSTPVLMKTPANPPFDSFDRYDGKATLASDGSLAAHFEISARGDDELLYRIGFHQTPRVQWQALVQNVSYATGFAGTVSNINASSPEQTAKPFHYSYDYTRKDYPDWPNRRILPLIPPVSFAYGEDDAKPVDTILLGGPTTYTFHSAIKLPDGYTAELPAAVKQQNNFAEYSSTYSQADGTLTIERTMTFKVREVPVARWDEYIKFQRAVQNEAGAYIQLIGSGTKQTASAAESNPDAANLVQQAFNDLRDRNLETAQQELDQAKGMNPKQVGLWSDYGSLYLSQGHREQGITAYRQEIQNHPENFAVYRSLAWTLSGANRADEGIAVLQDMLKVDPQQIDGRRDLASMLTRQKRYAEAVPVLEQAVKLSPESANLKVMLGSAEISSGAKEKGAALLKETLTAATDESILNDAAYELADADVELPLARASCEKALLQLDEQTSKISLAGLTDDDLRKVAHLGATWDTMAWILYRQGELARAEDYAKAAWMLEPNPTVGYHLGHIYESLGNKASAIRLYRLAIASSYGYDSPGVKDAHDRLMKLTSSDLSMNEKASAGEDLAKLRTVNLVVSGKKNGSADFLVLFSPGRIEDIRFLSGDAPLKPSADLLRKAAFDVPFPSGSGAKIVRRGIFYCAEVPKDCQFTMLPPETARRN